MGLDVVELIMNIEDELGVPIEKHINSVVVSDICKYLAANCNVSNDQAFEVIQRHCWRMWPSPGGDITPNTNLAKWIVLLE